MPDVLTHLLVGISIALLIRMNGPRSEQMLVVLGAVLIDAERPIMWLLQNTPFYWIDLTSAFHSIIGAVILSYVAATCFHLENVALDRRFMLILIGCTSHLILDVTMYPWAELGLYLFYPLKVAVSFHLFWPDFWLYPLIGVASLLFALGVRFVILRVQKLEIERDSS
jgi:hypothetical protein